MVDTLLSTDLNDYARLRAAILQTFNLSPEAYRRWLRDIDFGPDYHPRLFVQQIQAEGLLWLCPNSQSREQIVEAVLVEYYVTILPFKPNSWVLCHKLANLEEAIGLMEAYSSVEAGMYFIPKSWKSRGDQKVGPPFHSMHPLEGKIRDIRRKEENGRKKAENDRPSPLSLT